MTEKLNPAWAKSARSAIATELEGLKELLNALQGGLGQSVQQAVATIRKAQGRVIVSGMGKSGHIGRKIAATLASTGTPASFVHPAEASHGDLGMITTQDVVLMLSNSGESAELKDMLSYCARFSVPMIAITSEQASTLSKAADVALVLPKAKEACPNGQAPTTSTLLQLAIGDALAIALLEDKGFSAQDFKAFHPGGKLGAQMKRAQDIMRTGDALPLVQSGSPVAKALPIMNAKKLGCVGIVDGNGKLVGLITDGDLRRGLGDGLMQKSVDDIMTKSPVTIHGDLLAAEVIELINTRRITSVFIVDELAKPLGIIHLHDLLALGAG